MAAPTGTVQTYGAKGIAEDFENVIYNIAPTDTPFLSALDRVKVTNTLHQWQTDSLDAAANNAQVEGDDAAAPSYAASVPVNNNTQISGKTVIVSGTQDAVRKYGRDKELAYQIAKKGKELKRDMETALCQNTTTVVGNATTARQLRGLEGWVATNNSLGATGAAPVPGSNTAPTDGTQRAFTETLLKDVLQKCFTQGGNPTLLMVGPAQKQVVSTFGGNATRFKEAEDSKLNASIDFYKGDFGTLAVKPNRFQRNRTAFALDMDYWALCVLRPMSTNELAKTGDAEKRQLLTEYTLVSRQEAASGAVRDLT